MHRNSYYYHTLTLEKVHNDRLMCVECIQVPVVCELLSTVRSKQAILKHNGLFDSENKAICNKEPFILSNPVTINKYNHPAKRLHLALPPFFSPFHNPIAHSCNTDIFRAWKMLEDINLFIRLESKWLSLEGSFPSFPTLNSKPFLLYPFPTC